MGITQGATVYALRDWPDGSLHKGDAGTVLTVSIEGLFNEPMVLVDFGGQLFDCWEHSLTTIRPEVESR